MWGGEGLLGCGVGFGLLHRIPKPSSEQQHDAFQDNYTSSQRDGDQSYEYEAELFVPADHLAPDDVFPGDHPPHPVTTPSSLSDPKTDQLDEAMPTSPLVPPQPSSLFTAVDEATDIEVPTPTPSSPVSSQFEAPSQPHPLQLPSTFTGNGDPVSNPRNVVRSPGSPMLRQFSNPTFGTSRFGSIQNRISSPVPRSGIPRMAQGVDSDEGGNETTSTKRTSNGSVTSVDE